MEEIKSHKTVNGQLRYLLKWCDHEKPTWVRVDQLKGCADTLREYQQRQGIPLDFWDESSSSPESESGESDDPDSDQEVVIPEVQDLSISDNESSSNNPLPASSIDVNLSMQDDAIGTQGDDELVGADEPQQSCDDVTNTLADDDVVVGTKFQQLPDDANDVQRDKGSSEDAECQQLRDDTLCSQGNDEFAVAIDPSSATDSTSVNDTQGGDDTPADPALIVSVSRDRSVLNRDSQPGFNWDDPSPSSDPISSAKTPRTDSAENTQPGFDWND